MQNNIYRAKRKDNEEWVEGYLYIYEKGEPWEATYILETLSYYEHKRRYGVWKRAWEVFPETVCHKIV